MPDFDDGERLARTEEILGYEFTDRGLLRTALSHASEKSESPETAEPRTDAELDNERLEFLGDSVLGMLICERLFGGYPEYTEGELTRIKSVVVSKRVLAGVTKKLGMDAYLAVGKGMAARQELPASVLADLFEAVVAAMYLDAGLERAREFVLEVLGPEIDLVDRNEHQRNYKSILQQFIQRRKGATPIYRVLTEEGPDHSKLFEVAVFVDDKEQGRGRGRSKKEAQQRAAMDALEALSPEFARGDEAPGDFDIMDA
jgi:ribonuclease-3